MLSNRTSKKDQINGFTLVELLITVGIVAILIGLAYPSFKETLYKMEANRIKSTFKTTINRAKIISYSQHKSVFMCLLDDNGHCDKNGNQSLILFFDNNDNKEYNPATDTLIENNLLQLKYAKTHTRPRDYIKFASDTGLPRGYFGHFKYCPLDANNPNIYQISFNQMGIIRYKPNGIHPTGC